MDALHVVGLGMFRSEEWRRGIRKPNSLFLSPFLSPSLFLYLSVSFWHRSAPGILDAQFGRAKVRLVESGIKIRKGNCGSGSCVIIVN